LRTNGNAPVIAATASGTMGVVAAWSRYVINRSG
jgi:hypothetical protein